MIGRDEWIDAAARAMSEGGVEAVRVEALARGLGVTKGSFYWHFEDRPALLTALLERWEVAARAALEGAAGQSRPEQRIGSLFRQLSQPTGGLTDAEVRAWARRERGVAERVAELERQRVVFLKEQLGHMGASAVDAHRRAEAGYLAAIAWLERASRTPWMKSDYGSFVQEVFRLLLQVRAVPAGGAEGGG
ncbi:MAG TPA: helix-turn-helix domain-containing protein [Longimicrobiales bacterium]